MKNAWVDRFELLRDCDSVQRRASYFPEPLHGLEALRPAAAAISLRDALSEVFVCTGQHKKILTDLAEQATQFSALRYPDCKTFMDAVHAPSLEISEGRLLAVCLTGLAGVGKSAILKALGRLMPKSSEVKAHPDYSPFPLESLWAITIDTAQGELALLKALCRRAGIQIPPRTDTSELKQALIRRAHRNGVTILRVDEFQFVNQGGSANAKVTRFLLLLRELGIILVYSANCSLLHRLGTRNNEDRHRLLQSVIALLPEEAASPWWKTQIEAFCAVAPDVFRLDPIKDAEKLWFLTAAVPRHLRELLIAAYEIARSGGRTVVEVGDVQLAYSCPAYSMFRLDTEAIHAQNMTGEMVRKDLWVPPQYLESKSTASKAMLEKAHHEADATTYLFEALTVRERQALGDVSRAVAIDQRPAEQRVTPMRKKKNPRTAASLAQGDQLFRKECL